MDSAVVFRHCLMKSPCYLSAPNLAGYPADDSGRVAERLNAPVLKTGDGKPSVGSNPTPSATQWGGAAKKHAYSLSRALHAAIN